MNFKTLKNQSNGVPSSAPARLRHALLLTASIFTGAALSSCARQHHQYELQSSVMAKTTAPTYEIGKLSSDEFENCGLLPSQSLSVRLDSVGPDPRKPSDTSSRAAYIHVFVYDLDRSKRDDIEASAFKANPLGALVYRGPLVNHDLTIHVNFGDNLVHNNAFKLSLKEWVRQGGPAGYEKATITLSYDRDIREP